MGFIPEHLLMMMMGIRNYHVGVLKYISKSFLLAVSGVSLESCKNNATLELKRRIGLAAMTFGKLKSMFFTSKKVSLRVKNNATLA